MANQKNENSQPQDNAQNKDDNLEDELYKELEKRLDGIEDKFEQNVRNHLNSKEEEKEKDYHFQEDSLNDFEVEEETEVNIPISPKKIEPEPTFKNSYTEKINIASKKREEALAKPPNKYLKYGGIGAEMIGSVILGSFAGNWLDKKMELDFPVFTIVLIFLGLTATFYHLIRQLNADQKEDENTKNTKD